MQTRIIGDCPLGPTFPIEKVTPSVGLIYLMLLAETD